MNADEFAAQLSNLRQAYEYEETPDEFVVAADELKSAPALDRNTLCSFLEASPRRLAIIASAVGISREQLKNQLKHLFGSGSSARVVRERRDDLLTWLIDDLHVLSHISRDVGKDWTLADVLFERVRWTSRSAGRSVASGRTLEDDVEEVIRQSGASYVMRTTFIGTRGTTAPCDFAIPAGGQNALLVGVVKGFNSTGSKLTDAVREITELADKRLPRQFVFAVVDGLGWLNRRSDLARIVNLHSSKAIDGAVHSPDVASVLA